MLNKIKEKLILLYPVVLFLGILDYRFSNTLYPNLSKHLQIFKSGYFDHTSILTLSSFALILILIHELTSNKTYQENTLSNLKKAKYFLIPLLLSLFITTVTTNQISPIIRSTPQIIILFWLIPLSTITLYINYIISNQLEAKLTQNIKILSLITSSVILFQNFIKLFPGVTKDHLDRLSWPYIDPFNLNMSASPNLLAYIYAPLTIFAFVQTYKKRNLLNFINLLLTTSILLLTQSYTAAISTISVIFIYLFYMLSRANKIKLVAITSIIFTTIVITQYQTPKFQILLGRTDTPNSITERGRIYKVTYNLIKESPLIGLGFNNYQEKFKSIQSEILDQPIIEREVPPHPHNLILNAWVEFGLLGAITFLSLYISLAKHILQTKKNELSIFTLILLYFCIHGLIDTPLFLEEHYYLFLAIILSFFSIQSSQKSLTSN